MKRAKCINCGAMIELNRDNQSGKCPYCNTTYIQGRNESEKDNIVDDSTRPTINWAVAIILFCFFFWGGIAYLAYKLVQQKKWDDNHKTTL